MSVDVLVNYLKGEWGVITGAPFSLVMLAAIIALVAWRIIDRLYHTQIASLQSRLELRNDQIANYKNKLGGASPEEAKELIAKLQTQINSPIPVHATAEVPQSSTPSERTTLLQFRTQASTGGWPADLSDDRWLMLLSELRQAGSDGVVSLWGRRRDRSLASVLYDEHERKEPLVQIPKEHWAHFEIEPQSFLMPENEASPRTYNIHLSDWGRKDAYYDLHVGTADAGPWLRTVKVPD